jgi:hypothetical protein
MSVINIGTVCAMNPGCIRTNVRQSWGITRADASKLLFVWNHETREDEQGLWVNLYDPRSDVGYGGQERIEHVRAIEAGTVGNALVGFVSLDADGSKHWNIIRGDPEYRIVTTRVDGNGVIWGRLQRFDPPRPPKPYRRDYEERA